MESLDLRRWPQFVLAGGDTTQPAMVDQIVIDSRRIHSSYALFVALPGDRYDGHAFIAQAAAAGARYAIVAKEWNPSADLNTLSLLRVENPLIALQDLAALYRQLLPATVVAITGSYGKTMVKDLLYRMVMRCKSISASPESFNSQIGVALSLFSIKQHHEIALIEAGISKPGEMLRLHQMIRPDHAILTNIGKAHLNTLGSLETTAREKIKLLENSPPGHWNLLPHNITEYTHSPVSPPTYCWDTPAPSLPHASWVDITPTNPMRYRLQYPTGEEFIGKSAGGFSYFLDIVNIASKAAWLLGVGAETIRAVLQEYTPEPMRTEIWRSPTGTTFINDTYCSDPFSVDKALKTLHLAPTGSRKVFAFGGMRGNKHAKEYQRVGKALQEYPVDKLLLFGNHDFSPLVDQIRRGPIQVQINHFSNYTDTINHLRTTVEPNDTVLIKGVHKESLETIKEAFDDSISNNQCTINLTAIAINIESLRKKLAAKTRLMVMVKAMAYGTDDIRMAKFLSTCGVDILGVSYVDEGVALKYAGIQQEIFVINASLYEAAKVVKWDLQVGVSQKEIIDALALEASRQGKRIKIHLCIETGMSRFGCRPEEALEIAQYITAKSSLQLEGIMTHFACADEPSQDSFTLGQAALFQQSIEALESHGIAIPWKHASNSSAIIRFDFPQFNMVRPGLAIYGLHASKATHDCLELKLALSLTSHIVNTQTCKKGDSIGYGRSYRVEEDAKRIAILPIGYFDGLHRHYSGKGHAIIRGKQAPMVGNICMDYMMVDISKIPDATIGDSVLIFGCDDYGHRLQPEDLALQGGSIIHELITCLGPRIQRVFVYEES